MDALPYTPVGSVVRSPSQEYHAETNPPYGIIRRILCLTRTAGCVRSFFVAEYISCGREVTAVQRAWYRIFAAAGVCAAIAAAAQAVRGSEMGQHLPSLALHQAVQTVGSGMCDGDFSAVTAVFSHVLVPESDAVSVAAPSVPAYDDEDH